MIVIMTSTTNHFQKLIKSYRQIAHQKYLEGKRDYYLPCENKLGGHCSELMERDVVSGNIYFSIKNHIKRCPRGKFQATRGLLGALVMVAIPFAMLTPSDGFIMGCENINASMDSCGNCMEDCNCGK
jgi:hypothetical protein